MKILMVAFGIALGVTGVSVDSKASLGSTIGGMIDCPSSGIPCQSDADSSQTQKCKITVGASVSYPGGIGVFVSC
jgi:hypothetical protein